jgi:hypothetical protein
MHSHAGPPANRTFSSSLRCRQFGAVWYGARRIRAYALVIRAGIPIGGLRPYLRQRAWLIDAARLLRRTPEDLAAEMIGTMLRSGAIVRRDQRIHAAADYVPVAPGRLDVPLPPRMATGRPRLQNPR